MKRMIPAILLVMITILTACGSEGLTSSDMTAAVQTMTATVMTPTITPTPAPNTNKIVLLLNEAVRGVDPLAEMIDASFVVTDAVFIPNDMGKLTTLEIRIHCTCIRDIVCCTPGRTFVTLINALWTQFEKIGPEIPDTITELHVACYEDNFQEAMVIVGWRDVLAYIREEINGYQFSERVNILTPY